MSGGNEVGKASCETVSSGEEQTERYLASIEQIGKAESPGIEPTVAATVEETLAQRGKRYGDFTDHAALCQNLMGIMQSFEKPLAGQESVKEGDKERYSPWQWLPPVHRQALTVIADKIARILSGDPNYDDNWRDIQGYAKLVEDRLPPQESN